MAKKVKKTKSKTGYMDEIFEKSLWAFRTMKSQEQELMQEHGNPSENENPWELYDMDENRYSRRQRAAEKYLPFAREYASQNGPEILFQSEMAKNEPEQFSFDIRWARLNSYPQVGYDDVNREEYLTMAAAIWILDRISDYNHVPILDENGNIETNSAGYAKTRREKLMELLPLEQETEYLDLPHIWDSCHSEEIIREVTAVIEQRNDDCSGKRYRKDHASRALLDCFTTEGTQHQDVPSRRRFEALLALIPEEDKADMAEQYQQTMWEWMGMYFSALAEIIHKEDEVYSRMTKQVTELNELYRERDKKTKALKRNSAKQKPAPMPLMNPLMMNPSAMKNPLMSMMGQDNLSEKISLFEKRLELTVQQFSELQNQEHNFYLNLELMISEQPDAVIEKIDRFLHDREASARAANAFSGISIRDPYGLCFGLLYLIDSGSDLPWLYFPSVSIAKLTAIHLPWHHGTFDEMEDEVWDLYFVKEAFEVSDKELSDEEYVRMKERAVWEKLHREITYPKSLRVPEIPDWNQLNLTSKDDAFFDERSSLAQVIYDLTGGIMPRKMNRYEKALPTLSRYGIRGQKALAYEYAMLLMGEAQRRSEDWRMSEYDITEDAHMHDSDTADTAAEDEVDADEAQQMKQQIAEMKKEIAMLKEMAHSANRAAQDERRKNEKLSKESEQERQELYALRELVFAKNNGTDEEEPAEETIELPYSVEKRTVVFGGHDSWARAIKPMLTGNIRFITRSTKPSPDLIRHADVIWIQSNSLAHKEYYAIMNVVRIHKIPVEYFQYASAEKCARQLAECDQKE